MSAADIDHARREFLALTSSVQISTTPPPVNDDNSILLETSLAINESLFIDSARSIAAIHGYRLKSRGEVKRFVREHASAPQSSGTAMPRESANTQIRSRQAKIDYIASRLASGFALTAPPLDAYGNIAETAHIKCPAGHVHVCRTDAIIENGLSSCHTCKCADPVINAVRKYMEGTTDTAYTLGGDNWIHSQAAAIYVHFADGPRARVRGGDLHITVSHSADALSQLESRIRSSSYILPDKRALRALVPRAGAPRTDALRTDAPHNDSLRTGTPHSNTPSIRLADALRTTAVRPQPIAPACNYRATDVFRRVSSHPSDIFGHRLTPTITSIFG